MLKQQHDDNAIKYGVSHSRMWAQYSNNHKGICFLFDGKALHKNIEDKVKANGGIVHYGFVRYNYEKSILPVQGDNTKPLSLFENYKENFLYKSTEWKAEHEFRWLVYDGNPPLK